MRMGSYRVIRGGGWHFHAYDTRCADRGGWPDGADYDRDGFRVARGQP